METKNCLKNNEFVYRIIIYTVTTSFLKWR